MSYTEGDLLFFNALDGNFIDSIIQGWTASHFVHCAIVISPTHKIEALGNGVQINPINDHVVSASWSYQSHASPFVQENLQQALLWLRSQVGQTYGYGDILDAALEKVENVVTFDIGGHFDCSGLATEFLLKAGGVSALQNITDAHTITPAKLAELLGVTFLSSAA